MPTPPSARDAMMRRCAERIRQLATELDAHQDAIRIVLGRKAIGRREVQSVLGYARHSRILIKRMNAYIGRIERSE